MKTLLVLLFSTVLLFGQVPEPTIRTYTVSTAATFPSLMVSGYPVLVFRNGILQTPTVSYNSVSKLPNSSVFTFKPGVLVSGDKIQFVTLPPMQFGPNGFVVATSIAGSQVFVDTAYVTYRTAAPNALGIVCDAGTGSWATDASMFYFCTPNSTGDGFVWSGFPYGFKVSTRVYGEVATGNIGNAGSWTLAHTPLNGIGCYVGGMRQLPSSYALSGNVLTSTVWQPSDVVLCDYDY